MPDTWQEVKLYRLRDTPEDQWEARTLDGVSGFGRSAAEALEALDDVYWQRDQRRKTE